ncbi:MAG: hypothetical protein AAB948_03255, partial [Patescibacteria group bacterium]
MRFYSNKAFVFILLLIVVSVYSFPKTAKADDALIDFEDLFDNVFNLVLANIMPLDIYVIGFIDCKLLGNENPIFSNCGEEGNSSSSGSGTQGSPTLNSQTATPIVQNSC